MVMGVVGILLYPVGIPVMFLVLLWRAGVPQMANVKLNRQLAHVLLATAADDGVVDHEVVRGFSGHTWDLPDDLVHLLWSHFCSRENELKKLMMTLVAPTLANRPREVPSPLVQRFHLVSWARHSPMISLKKLTWDVRVPEEKQALDRAGFLFADYHIGCWYWEVYDLCRKLMLSSVIIFVEPGKPSQILIGIIISFVTLLLTVHMDPYIDGDINRLSEFALVVTFFTLLSGFSLKVNIVSADDAYFNVLVTSLVLSVAVMPFLFVFFALYNMVGRQFSWKMIAKYYKRVEQGRTQLAADEIERVADIRREFTRRRNVERSAMRRELDGGLAAGGGGGGAQRARPPRGLEYSLSHRVYSEMTSRRHDSFGAVARQETRREVVHRHNSDGAPGAAPATYRGQRRLTRLTDEDFGPAAPGPLRPPDLQLNRMVRGSSPLSSPSGNGNGAGNGAGNGNGDGDGGGKDRL